MPRLCPHPSYNGELRYQRQTNGASVRTGHQEVAEFTGSSGATAGKLPQQRSVSAAEARP